jgi:NAD(P)-dependent dehydrogenase (short-subunit alcohol dehydrogenase family)
MRVVVTGASRGIGLELVRQFAQRGALVEAATRHPASATALRQLSEAYGDAIRVHRCDVSQDSSVQRFARNLGVGPIDLLFNNAGVPPSRDRLHSMQPGDELLQTLNVNAVGPLRVTRALLAHLRAGSERKIVHIGSALGSIAEAEDDSVGYRMSKAALNMASRVLANGLRTHGVTSVVVHPGWVQTDMGGPRARISVQESVERILELTGRLSLRQSGRFFDYRGKSLPW